jgi:hypothetical protein
MGHDQSAKKRVSQYGGLPRVVAAAICVSFLAACGGSNGDLEVTADGNATDYVVPAAATMAYFKYGSAVGGSCPSDVAQWASGLVGYPEDSPGPVTPAVSTTSPNSDCPQNRYFGMAIDSSGYVYVASDPYVGSNSMPAVLVFAPAANGMAAPVRTLVVPGGVGAIAVDNAANVYVASGNSVLEFAAGANGNAAPIRTMNVAETCVELAVDGAGNIVCVPYHQNGLDEIQVFTSGAPATPRALRAPSQFAFPLLREWRRRLAPSHARIGMR